MHFDDMPHLVPEDLRRVTAPFTTRFPTSPRLVETTAGELHAMPRATVANLAIPAARVEERTAALVHQATARGRGHSLRLWRQALPTALVELAREASGLAPNVACRAFSWEVRGADYHVMATFTATSPVH